MANYRSFAAGTTFPSTWTNAIEQLVSGLASGNFKLTVASSTSVQIAGAAAEAQVPVATMGKPRWNTANATATHPGGTAGVYDVYVTSNADTFGTDGSGHETDTTDHSFGLKIVASGATPSGSGAETNYRKIGEVDWDSAKITGFRQTFGPFSNTQPLQAVSPNANITPVYGKGAASQAAPLERLDDSTGAQQWAVSVAGVANATSGYQIGGVALASTHLSDTAALARLASPTFTGTPAGPTAAVDTNTTQLATTAYVVGQGYLKSATAASTYAPLASPTFTGTPAGPTAAVNTNTTQLATTAFVYQQTGQTLVLSGQTVGDVGVVGQIRAGRELVATDFTTLLGLSTPVGLWDAGSLTNLGSGGNLVNKGTVPLTAKGLAGTANHAALFAGSTGQALYIADTGAADPFRLKTGSWGCWHRTAKRGTFQVVMSKWHASTAVRVFYLGVDSTNVATASVSIDGNAGNTVYGVTDVADDRPHFIEATFDGSVLRLYVDGAIEGSLAAAGTMFSGSSAFNIGGYGADAGTAASSPSFGRVMAPHVTKDVLNEDQIRLLMAAKVAHGYSTTPTRSSLAIRRKRKGGVLATGDFTSTPKRLYNLDNSGGPPTGDLGSNGATLTGNGGPKDAPGPEGLLATSTFFEGTATYYTATDTGLPSGTASRSVHTWIKTGTTFGSIAYVLMYGSSPTAVQLYVDTAGKINYADGVNGTVGNFIADGQWHHVVVVIDNAATDGQKVKVYVDGKFVAGNTALNGTTLNGTLAIGRANSASSNFFLGALGRVAVTDYAMAEDEILNLYAKGSVAMPASEKNPGDHVEAMDATNVYCLFDSLDSQHSVDLRVAA